MTVYGWLGDVRRAWARAGGQPNTLMFERESNLSDTNTIPLHIVVIQAWPLSRPTSQVLPGNQNAG